MYALADCNNFFVSCERVFRPDLEGKPVVVLSNNDGCAVSRSNEAKRLGIKMGQPLFEFKELVESGLVTIFSSNYVLYGEMSSRVQHVLSGAAPSIEIYSIDESFLDLNGMEHNDLDLWAKSLSARCNTETGIPISVGVAPTKTLAKIASKLCKQYPKTNGGCFMHKPQQIEKVLKNFPIEDIWGIGRKYSSRFKNYYGLTTAYDFYMKDEPWIHSEMGITGVRTWRELHSIPSISFEDAQHNKKQIMVSRSFSEEIASIEELSKQVSLFCSIATEKLRKQHSCCNSATVFIRTNRFKNNISQQFEGKLITFPVATNSTIEINAAVIATLHQLFRPGVKYKKAGVMLTEIIPDNKVQLSFFDDLDRDKHTRLMKAIDSINTRTGHTSIGVASQSFDGFKMHRDHLSPCYTTDWNDILVVKC